MKKALLILASLGLATPLLAAPSEEAVVSHYADIGEATFGDALITGRELQKAVNTLLATPSEKNLAAARAAWKRARIPYMQSEVFRFGNPIVDAWEGRVNAWPLDEGMIDYVAASYGEESDENPYYTANVIANPKLVLGGKSIDATTIDKKLLAETLHELDGVEANVATGYHAIEFMLWGQDLNGTGPGAGARPASDYDVQHCSHGHCERRAAYLKAATDLLVDDLDYMHRQWLEGGAARQALMHDTHKGIADILKGIGSLSYGELAGERIKLGLMLHDPEEEPDCFSDYTHYSHYYDAVGMRNVYTGRYQRASGKVLQGPSVADLLKAKDSAADRAMRERLGNTIAKMQVLVDSAEKQGIAYDQLLAEGNSKGNARLQEAVDALLEQARAVENAVNALQLSTISFGGSASEQVGH